MTPEEGSARTAGERHQERIVGSPRSPLASLRPLVAAGGVAAQDGLRLEAGPHLALQLPGVATTVNSSSVPEGGRTNFSPSLLFRGSWVAIPREGLADVWGSVCRIVLQTSSPTIARFTPEGDPSLLFPIPTRPHVPRTLKDRSSEVEGATLPALFPHRAHSSPGQPTPLSPPARVGYVERSLPLPQGARGPGTGPATAF